MDKFVNTLAQQINTIKIFHKNGSVSYDTLHKNYPIEYLLDLYKDEIDKIEYCTNKEFYFDRLITSLNMSYDICINFNDKILGIKKEEYLDSFMQDVNIYYNLWKSL